MSCRVVSCRVRSYEGDYVAGEAHGRGKFSFANGTCYEGTLSPGFLPVTITDGVVGRADVRPVALSGEIVMGYFEGAGKFTFANGAIYEGQFKVLYTHNIY